MTEKNWIEEAIEREALPKPARKESVADFASKWGIDESTYYYQMRKPENEKKVLELSLSEAKKGTSDVLDKLREKAEGGSDKAMEMYLKFVLALSEKSDITSKGERIMVLPSELITKHDALPRETSGDSEGHA